MDYKVDQTELELDTSALPILPVTERLQKGMLVDLSDEFTAKGSQLPLLVAANTIKRMHEYFAETAPNYEREIVSASAIYIVMRMTAVIIQQAHQVGGALKTFAVITEIGDVCKTPTEAALMICYDGSIDRQVLVWGYKDDVEAVFPELGQARSAPVPEIPQFHATEQEDGMLAIS